jgi:hypothetical protein
MKKSLVQRLVVLLAAGAAGMSLSGGVAAAQEDAGSPEAVAAQAPAIKVEVSASVRPAPEVCQNPPCTPPTPPDQRATCVLTITRPHLGGLGSFRVDSEVKCVKGTGAPLVMRELTMLTKFKVDGETRVTSPKGGLNRSSVKDFVGWPHDSRCKYYQGIADAQLTWPNGWIGDGDGTLSVHTANERWCA